MPFISAAGRSTNTVHAHGSRMQAVFKDVFSAAKVLDSVGLHLQDNACIRILGWILKTARK